MVERRRKECTDPNFGGIVASHLPEEQSGFSLCLSFDEGPKEQVLKVHRPVMRFDIGLDKDEIYVGFSSPLGIVPISTASKDGFPYLEHFKELEYVKAFTHLHLPSDYFFPFHNLREVRMDGPMLGIQPSIQFSSDLPFLHTLRVLDVCSIQSSFLAGQTFHKLKRYREHIDTEENNIQSHLLTEMPVCTRLEVPLSRLATLKVPQACELSVSITRNHGTTFWETVLAVNANLSNVKFLQVWQFYGAFGKNDNDAILKLLESFPALETLVVDISGLDFSYAELDIPCVDLLKAFVPMDAEGTSGLNQPSQRGQISGALCPRLESMQIEGIRPTRKPELMPVLEDIVTLRTSIGCPLKSFTFYCNRYSKKWELIGRDRCFNMEEVVLAQAFILEI